MLEDLIDRKVNLATIDCLAHIFQFSDSLKSYEKKISLLEPYQVYV